MFQEFQGIEITALAACVPKNKIGNNFFGDLLSPKESRIFEKTVGIIERRWAANDVTSSDLGYVAVLNLLNNHKVNKDEIDCLIFLSQTPDHRIPFTSNILQDRLGLKKEMLCLDINAGCTGFIQGLSVSFSMAKSLKRGKILFIVGETLSKILSHKDRATTMLFGDGAAAILIENTGKIDCKAYFNFYSDGANADAIKIPDGGYRSEVTIDSLLLVEDEKFNLKNRLHLTMDGPKVFDFTLREIAPSIEELFKLSKVNKDAIEYFMLHQSNQFIIKQIAAQLGVSQDKMLININEFGNTSGVSIPLLISSYAEKLKDSQTILLSGYGVGLNWGNCIIENMGINILKKEEI